MVEHRKIRVGILFGGVSAEHEISILSARNVLEALDHSRFEPVLIGIDRSGQWRLQDERKLLALPADPHQARVEPAVPVPLALPLIGGKPNPARPTRDAAAPAASARPPAGGESGSADAAGHVDIIFPVLHGTLGEDGVMQGLFEAAGIPYVGAGVLGSAIGMDKDVMKRLLRDAGVAVADFRAVRRDRFDADPQRACDELAALGFPLFTKPANAGSSIGIRKVAGHAELEAALRHAFEFDSKVIAEAAVSGREIELAVLGGTTPMVSVPGEIIVEHAHGFYSYEAKYLDEHGARLEIPARMPPQQRERSQALALRAFDVLECEGMARVDLFLRPDGEFIVNEINTIPGFTAISMYPRLWAASGIPPTELVTRLIELGLERARRRAQLKNQR